MNVMGHSGSDILLGTSVLGLEWTRCNLDERMPACVHVCVCVCVCVHAPVCAAAHLWVCVHVAARGHLQVSILRGHPLTGLELTNTSSSRDFLVCFPPSLVTGECYYAWFVCFNVGCVNQTRVSVPRASPESTVLDHL